MENLDLFENLYRRYFSKAYRSAYLVAQDCVQEAFLVTYEILKKTLWTFPDSRRWSELSLPKKPLTLSEIRQSMCS